MTDDQQQDSQEAMDRLVAQDQIMIKARMLPDGPLEPRHFEGVREAIDDLRQHDKAVTLSRIAKENEWTPSVVSQFMSGTYKGDNELVCRQLNLWLERRARREMSLGPNDYVSTWVCEEMKAAVGLADRRRKMAAIVAPSGSGKDMVIEILAEKLNGLVVYCDGATTPTMLVKKIAHVMGLRNFRSGSVGAVTERIIERLRDRNRILFLNEAQMLRRDCAGIIRSIYDQTHVSICLFGSQEIFSFIDDRATADKASGGGQFYRRCIKVNILNRAEHYIDPNGTGKKMGRPLFTRDEIRRFLDMKGVRLSTDTALDLLWRIANVPEGGTLGIISDIVETCADLFPKKQITTQMINGVMPIILDSEATYLRQCADALDEHGMRRRAG